MRKSSAFAALVVAGLGCALAIPAVAAPRVPTCLIVNGGGSGGFTKSVVCAELRDQGGAKVGYGRYSAGGGGHAWVDVDVEVRAHPGGAWTAVMSARVEGTDSVEATTRPVGPGSGELRACATAGVGNGRATKEVCSS